MSLSILYAISYGVIIILMLLITAPNFVSNEEISLPKICIIGGGPSGSSAGYYLREYFGDSLDVDMFEGGITGGRLATVNIAGRDFEAGGSIVHARNQYMTNFTKMLGFHPKRKSQSGVIGMYDGDEMVFTTSNYAYLNIAKALWNYGLSVVYLYDLVESSLNEFDRIYAHQAEGYAFTTPEKLLGSLSAEFLKQLKVSIDDYMTEREYDRSFIDQFVMSAMLTNYGQQVSMQAFAASVALGGIQEGLWSVHGGNKNVPTELIKLSEVNLIKAKVTKVSLLSDDKFKVSYTESGVENSAVYDVVILGAPLENSGIQLENIPRETPVISRKFHRTVASFVYGSLNASYFGFSTPHDLPKGILSINPDLPFNSIGYQDPVDYGNQKEAPIDFSQDTVWKVFSQKPLTPEQLDKMFIKRTDVKVVDWLAYPHFTSQPYNKPLPRFELHKNLYYPNAIEWTASAIETAIIAGRNVALLTINSWEGNLSKVDSSVVNAHGVSHDEL